MKQRHPVRRILLCMAVLLLADLLYHGVCIWRYAGVDETRAADAAIVLGAAAYESGPSPVYTERLNHGIWLYQQGYVQKLILTGGTAAGNTRSDAAIGAAYVLQQGVPEADILLEELSTVTEENLRNAAGIMAREGMKTALIVSDPLHMKRSMLLAKDAGLTAFTSPTPTTRYRSLGPRLQFLARELFFYVGYRWVRLFRRLCRGFQPG